ncbi:MAG: hypothetical protein JNL18_17420 [Planctomycetaceae bacterium]|nr:hypothetical protein [Planctomycetaceae bacterium]
MIRLVGLAALLLVLGCSGSGDALVPVTGTVKNADSSPLAFEAGTVSFFPSVAEKPASGTVDQSGSFTMTTTAPNDGVQPGKYKVVIQLWKNYRDLVPAMPVVYGDVATTPLEVTVDADHGHFDFSLEK